MKEVFGTEREPRRSLNWDEFQAHPNQENFPYDVGFPNVGPADRPVSMFQLFLSDGTSVIACVDFSTQYRAEGLRWSVGGPRGHRLGRHLVKAWYEKLPGSDQKSD